MPKSALLLLLAAAALLAGGGGACYQDDEVLVPLTSKPVAKVLLTDAPFPYDSVASVNIYVVRIEASALADTSGGGDWVLVTEPKKTFDLLTLQQGAAAFVGEGELPAGQYHAIRMTIDTSLSSIVWNDGGEARVNWQNWSGSNEMPLYALVESPGVNVPTDGAEIVIDFDIGRSFLYDFYGTEEFTLMPRLRAINSAATGAIAGTVTSDYTGETRPIANADITVCVSAACDPPNASILATGRSDAAGYYKVAFLRAGTYTVRIEQPTHPVLAPLIMSNVNVAMGDTNLLSVSLPTAGGGSGPFIRLSGPTSVGVGGRIALVAVVGDSDGNLVRCPDRAPVDFTSSDATIAKLAYRMPCGVPPEDTAYIDGVQPGSATISASNGELSDSHTIQVAGSPAPVATVTVVPASAELDHTLGDSAYADFLAELRDATGNLLLESRPVSWFSTDTTVFVIQFSGDFYYGHRARIVARGAGTALLNATSEGKVGQAPVTVR